MAHLTPQEQLMLELTNRARMDPAGEAKRFGIALNEGVPGATLTSTPKQVLAGNDSLGSAADKHSRWMIANDIFSHSETAGTSGFSGVDPGIRIKAAGYASATLWGENLVLSGVSWPITVALQTQLVIQAHEVLFVDTGVSGRGHRLNILHEGFKEIGIGQQIGEFRYSGVDLNSSLITQNFATSFGKAFVTGVVYNDTVISDNFFSVGEQVVNASVSSAGAAAEKTGAGGGYELLYTSAGGKLVSFSLPSGTVTVGLTLVGPNIKVDVVNGKEVWTNTSITTVSANVTELHVLGIAKVDLAGASIGQALFGNGAVNVLKGNGGNDTLIGKGGADKLEGGIGTDTASYAGSKGVIANLKSAASNTRDAAGDTYSSIENLAGSGYADVLTGNDGTNRINGGAHNDILSGGFGKDFLIGGSGNDTFVFNTKLGTTEVDTIDDFSVISDTMRLDDDIFAAIGGTGGLSSFAFRIGAAALDGTDRIIYDKTSGKLFYDADGTGSALATQMALLDKGLALTASDFVIVA